MATQVEKLMKRTKKQLVDMYVSLCNTNEELNTKLDKLKNRADIKESIILKTKDEVSSLKKHNSELTNELVSIKTRYDNDVTLTNNAFKNYNRAVIVLSCIVIIEFLIILLF